MTNPTWPPRPPASEEALRPTFEKAFMAHYTNGAHLLERFDTGHYRSFEAQAAWRIACEFHGRLPKLAPAQQAEPMRSRPLRFEPRDSGRWIDDDDFDRDAMLKISGDFGSDAEREQYATMLCERLNAADSHQPAQGTGLPADIAAMSEQELDDEIKGLGIDPELAAKRVGDAIARACGYVCRVCGQSAPHEHTPGEMVIFRNGAKAAAKGVDERAAFEAWARGKGFAATRTLPTDSAYSDSGSHIMWEAWQARAALAQAPAGWTLVPDYCGYAHLGIGEYVLNHSAAGEPPEVVISIASEEEKAGRAVGEERDNPPGHTLQADAMAVRLRFASPAGLAALESEIRKMRETHGWAA